MFIRPVIQPCVNAAATTISRNEAATTCLVLEAINREVQRMAKSGTSFPARTVEFVRLAKSLSNDELLSQVWSQFEEAGTEQENFGYFGVDDISLDVADGRARECSELERAQDVMYRAWTASGPRRVELAKEALAISADCTDALVLLAQESATSLSEARELLEKAVQIGEKLASQAAHDMQSRDSWWLDEARPYLRAKSTLAGTLWSMGERPRAIQLLNEVLIHEPPDWHAARFQLANWLLLENRDEEVGLLLDRYHNDEEAAWVFTRALWLFRRDREVGAYRALRRAFEVNGHVCGYLSGAQQLPQQMPAQVEPGEDSEAVEYAVLGRETWQQTPGALEWLDELDREVRIKRNLPMAKQWSELIELADEYEESEKYPKAYGKLRQALALAEKLDDVHFLVQTLYRLCDVCLNLEAEDEDEQFFRQLLSLVDHAEGDSNPAFAAALQRLGEFIANLGRSSEAQVLLERSIAVMEDDPEFRELLNETMAVLSEVYRAQGLVQQAEELERKQDQLQTELEAEQRLWDARDAEEQVNYN